MNITERYARETARDFAMRMLKRNIASLELAPGTMLSENELSAYMGLSRTPIRDALIELAKIRIVEILPQRGSRIALIDWPLVEESRFVRLVLEKAVIKLACAQAATLDFSIAEANVKLQQFYIENDVPEKLTELDEGFHREFFRLTNRLQTFSLLEGMALHSDRACNLTAGRIGETALVADHEGILRAVRAGEGAKAAALVEQHLARYRLDENDLRLHYPQYFAHVEQKARL